MQIGGGEKRRKTLDGILSGVFDRVVVDGIVGEDETACEERGKSVIYFEFDPEKASPDLSFLGVHQVFLKILIIAFHSAGTACFWI